MFSGSARQVPAPRSTRRIFPVHDMMLVSLIRSGRGRGGGVAQLVGPLPHAVETGPVGVDIGDGAGRAGVGAGRVAAAQVALLDLAGVLHIIDRAEWAGNGADLAAYADILEHQFGAGDRVEADRVDRTGMQAP